MPRHGYADLNKVGPMAYAPDPLLHTPMYMTPPSPLLQAGPPLETLKALVAVYGTRPGRQGAAPCRPVDAQDQQNHGADAPLELPDHLPIAVALQRALSRPDPQRYEPVIVRTGQGESDWAQVDVAQLCLVQCALQEAAVRRAREAEALLQRAACEDSVTGLPNRRLFVQQLDGAMARHRREPSRHFAVLCINFDRFNRVNTRLGHAGGDELLASIAGRLAEGLRTSDSLCRLSKPTTTETSRASSTATRVGGDEFLILLEDLKDPKDASVVAQRLRRLLARPHLIRGQAIHTSVSIGITGSEGGYTESEAVIRDADLAMERAKAEGGGRFVIFDAQMHADAVFRLAAEDLLREADQRDELVLHYQPIVSLLGGEVYGYEALLRWQCPQMGLVPPMRFIPLAEETGAITSLGRWALDRAVADVSAWQAQGHPMTVSVNVSPRQLEDADLIDYIRELLQRRQLSEGALRLEITESSVIQNRSRAVATLQSLREAGARVLLDDFGTGYSSLSHLSDLPLDGIKLDRSFTRRITDEPRQLGLVRAMVALARELEIDLVAEGIETVEQRDLLSEMGCPSGQGYLFAKPAPLASLGLMPNRAAA